MSSPVKRFNFERVEAVGVLLVDPLQETVFLVRQFRYPVYAQLKQEGSTDVRGAWLLEIVAGIRDPGLGLTEVVHKELFEEAGFRLQGEPERLGSVFPSPGGSSEKITIFCAEVEAGDQVAEGGGVVAEGEDTQVVEMTVSEALAKIETGEICDAKTVIALQAWALRKA